MPRPAFLLVWVLMLFFVVSFVVLLLLLNFPQLVMVVGLPTWRP